MNQLAAAYTAFFLKMYKHNNIFRIWQGCFYNFSIDYTFKKMHIQILLCHTEYLLVC